MIETQNLEKIGDQDISGKVFDFIFRTLPLYL
jgi:hypothetical protein